MEIFDVAIVGAGPAGSVCAAFCAQAGLRTLILEREKFPREKVCGDVLNTSCWSLLDRLNLQQRMRELPHARLDVVDFIAIGGRTISVELPPGEAGEVAVKRSLFDNLLLTRARELGVEVREQTTITELSRDGVWDIEGANGQNFSAHILVGADGRNSTVARLCNLSPKPKRERIALQSHLPLPERLRNRVVLQFLRGGYSGQAPVNDTELNVCLVSTPPDIARIKEWATRQFGVSPTHTWRTITPLTRDPIQPGRDGLFLIGDAARVVEPFTGEGIYYAMGSGDLAASAISKMNRGEDRPSTLREFARAYDEMYQGRLWINRLARASVLSPRLGSLLVHASRFHPSIARLLTAKIVTRY